MDELMNSGMIRVLLSAFSHLTEHVWQQGVFSTILRDTILAVAVNHDGFAGVSTGIAPNDSCCIIKKNQHVNSSKRS